METKDIIIIGGGAAGLMASCAAAHVLKKRGSVLVLEGNAKLGRKLLATGNGRCLLILRVYPALAVRLGDKPHFAEHGTNSFGRVFMQ